MVDKSFESRSHRNQEKAYLFFVFKLELNARRLPAEHRSRSKGCKIQSIAGPLGPLKRLKLQPKVETSLVWLVSLYKEGREPSFPGVCRWLRSPQGYPVPRASKPLEGGKNELHGLKSL